MPTTKNSTFTILLIEDNGGDVEMFLRAVEHELPRHEDEQVELVINATAEGGLERLAREPIDLVITDVRLPGMSGIELLRRVQDMNRRIPVIVVSWVNAVDTAIDAMRHGAFDYVVKPFDTMDLAARIHRAMRMADILRHTEPSGTDTQTLPFKDLVGVSPPIRNVMQMIEAIAKVPSTTLIIGETGTGKELIARSVHYLSQRSDGPYIRVNCGALSESLLESELFGHVKGAFTGAFDNKTGRFEAAHLGTIFLDEISSMSHKLQVKLLRVLQEREFERVGDSRTIQVDTRVVAATNQYLEDEIEAGRFREDLYYRLNVIELRLPPLAERPGDILPLAEHFLPPGRSLGEAARAALLQHGWPGNVRELKNVMQRAGLLAANERIEPADLGLPAVNASVASAQAENEPDRDSIERALARASGVVAQAAAELGLSRQALYRRMERLGIVRS